MWQPHTAPGLSARARHLSTWPRHTAATTKLPGWPWSFDLPPGPARAQAGPGRARQRILQLPPKASQHIYFPQASYAQCLPTPKRAHAQEACCAVGMVYSSRPRSRQPRTRSLVTGQPLACSATYRCIAPYYSFRPAADTANGRLAGRSTALAASAQHVVPLAA
jgi:hypothetical protein